MSDPASSPRPVTVSAPAPSTTSEPPESTRTVATLNTYDAASGGAGSTRTDPPPRTERNPEPAGPPSTLKPPATRMVDLSATETEGDTIHSVDEAAEREEDFFVGRKDGRDRSALAEPPWSRCASPVNATLSETSKWTTPPPPGASPPPPSPPRSPRANQPLEPAF